MLTDAGGEPNTYMTTDLALRRGQNLTLTNNGTNGLYDTESATAVYWLKQSTRYLLYNKANSSAVMGLAPGDIISYTTAPWRIGMYVVWGLAAAGILFGIWRTIQIANGKVKVEEKAKKAKENDEEEDY